MIEGLCDFLVNNVNEFVDGKSLAETKRKEEK